MANIDRIQSPEEPDTQPRQEASGFTPREFRNALGLFPTGVAVVTTRSPSGLKCGITVNSFTSVSLEPPLVSFNVAKSLHSIEDWQNAPTFAINLLHEGQHAVSNGFARARSDKWACTECLEGVTQNPILTSHLAVFECERYACYDAGDHLIVVGRVVHFRVDSEAKPLLFYRSEYWTLSSPQAR